MSVIHLPKYDSTREMIQNMRGNGMDWEQISNSYTIYRPVLPQDVDEKIWTEIVSDQKEHYGRPEKITEVKNKTTMVAKGEDNEARIPREQNSSWQLYKNKLLAQGWREEAVKNLEESTLTILKKLNIDTSETGPVKGLVIGQVQSGKTASMAGLMAMASDWGWNTFIVLSGMIENLRNQTQERLINDLNNNGNSTWISLTQLSRKNPPGQRLQDLNLADGDSQRYLNVCLKNKNRLENLVGWFNSDDNKRRQMKVLVIDDEADQASVNTKDVTKDDRTAINDLIIKLVGIGSDSGAKPTGMNYICYTATPYSNFLNESTPKSLYPSDFIGVLPASNEYFGPKQIFGLDEHPDGESGLDIVRNISDDNMEKILEIHEDENSLLPESLKNSICWFFCTVAVMRTLRYKKPVSMLVHTSQIQSHHNQLSGAIDKWITGIKEEDFINLCKKVYIEECEKLNLSKFSEGFPEYPVPVKELNYYPDFGLLISNIKKIKERISHIKMDEKRELQYHNGIHLCIDNCANNGIVDDSHIRLAYPSKEQLKSLSDAPAFIIVGGSTLSRGLTIEGLTTTYFGRNTSAGDSLMQMGRWFGYRKGYELFPRIWMPFTTYEKFVFLATLEEELREELTDFQLDRRSPSEYGPRIKNTPKVSWLRVTAKNKMQQAEEVDMDFQGCSIQTIHFDNDRKILENNIKVTDKFLEECPNDPKKSIVTNSVFFEGVDFAHIKNNLLQKLHFNSRSRVFNQINSFCDWYDQVKDEIGFFNWNVIVAGKDKVKEPKQSAGLEDKVGWQVGKHVIGKVNRSAKVTSMDYKEDIANIGVLRGPMDVFADIESVDFTNRPESKKGINNRTIRAVRGKYGLGNVPQLIIYRIDRKSSPADQDSKVRRPLKFDEDIIGIYISVPGSASSQPHAKGLRVKLDGYTEDTDHQM